MGAQSTIICGLYSGPAPDETVTTGTMTQRATVLGRLRGLQVGGMSAGAFHRLTIRGRALNHRRPLG